MNKFLASRLAAVVLFAIPLAHWIVVSDHAKVDRLATLDGQADYLAFLQRQTFGNSFFAFAVAGVLLVLAVELLSYLMLSVGKFVGRPPSV